MIDGIGIELAKIAGFRISVREGLEVNNELVGFESLPNVFDPFANLFSNRIRLDCGWWTERIVVAVSAPAHGYGSIAIRAREPGVDNDFVHAFAEFFLEPLIVGTEAFSSVWRFQFFHRRHFSPPLSRWRSL